MRILKHIALAAVLFCGSGLFTACDLEEDNQDNPVAPTDQQDFDNRIILYSHIQKDVPLLAEGISAGSLNVTSQAFTKLLELMALDKKFIANMNALFTEAAKQKALRSLSIVSPQSELAKMGYLAYLTVDNGGFGVRVIFDGKGGSKLLPAKNLEFVFPANIQGIGTTLYKFVISQSDECYQSVSSVNVHNLKRLACINRLPKAVTVRLYGFIANTELKLSESVINLELPLADGSEFVNFESTSFKLSGSQTSYINPGGATTLKYGLRMDGDNMGLSYAFSRNGTELIGCDAEMILKQKDNFLNRIGKNAIDAATLRSFTIRILDDLTITGDVTDGAMFAQNFAQGIKARQYSKTAGAQYVLAESFNESCRMQISCNYSYQNEIMKLCSVERDGEYLVEPAVFNLEGTEFIPISGMLDAQTMKSFNDSFQYSFTPAANASGSTLDFYSTFMQMMPLDKLPMAFE